MSIVIGDGTEIITVGFTTQSSKLTTLKKEIPVFPMVTEDNIPSMSK